MQAEGKLAAGTAKKYPNAIKAYGIIRRYTKQTTAFSNILPTLGRCLDHGMAQYVKAAVCIA